MRLLSCLTGIASLLMAVLLVVVANASGHRNLVWIFLAAISGWALIAAVFGLGLIAYGTRHNSIALGISAILTLLLVLPISDFTPFKTFTSSANAINLMSINTRLGEADVDTIVGLVGNEKTDILVMTETSGRFLRLARESDLAQRLPYHSEGDSVKNTVIWSRVPFIKTTPITGTMSDSVAVEIDTPSGPLTIVGVHPWNPANNEFGFVAGVKQWHEDYEILRAALRKITTRRVVLGDFNATVAHKPFKDLLRDGYIDAHHDVIPWGSNTYPTMGLWPPFPIIRIDHILLQKNIGEVRDYRNLPVPGTDHHGIAGTLVLKN